MDGFKQQVSFSLSAKLVVITGAVTLVGGLLWLTSFCQHVAHVIVLQQQVRETTGEVQRWLPLVLPVNRCDYADTDIEGICVYSNLTIPALQLSCTAMANVRRIFAKINWCVWYISTFFRLEPVTRSRKLCQICDSNAKKNAKLDPWKHDNFGCCNTLLDTFQRFSWKFRGNQAFHVILGAHFILSPEKRQITNVPAKLPAKPDYSWKALCIAAVFLQKRMSWCLNPHVIAVVMHVSKSCRQYFDYNSLAEHQICCIAVYGFWKP